MLVDVDFSKLGATPILAALGYMDYTDDDRVAVGVYGNGWSLGQMLKEAGLLVNEYPFKPWSGEKFPQVGDGPGEVTQIEAASWWDEYGKRPEDFGVCDNWEQITSKWPEITSSERRFVVGLGKVSKSAQSPSGGWRWHKWGDYIGTKDPQHEYLYDEGPEIESIYTFHIYEVRVAP